MRAVWYDRQGRPVRCWWRRIADARAGPTRSASGWRPPGSTRPTPIAAAAPHQPWNIPASSPPATAPAWWTRRADGARELGRQRVWLYNGQRNGRWMGTAAEYIALNADLVTLLPEHVSFAEGATLGVPGMTAHYCVFVAGPVQGRTLLVTGAAGAVGHYAVQLAKWAGATVIATVSSDAKAERARAGGADHVINYRSEDVAARVRDITGGEGVDHVVDVDFGGNLAATLRCVRANGSIAIYASNGDRTPRLPVGELMQRNVALYPMSLPGTPHAARKRAQSDIAQWIATGQRVLSVAARFPLYETAAAHEAVERGDKIGTVVIDCAR